MEGNLRNTEMSGFIVLNGRMIFLFSSFLPIFLWSLPCLSVHMHTRARPLKTVFDPLTPCSLLLWKEEEDCEAPHRGSQRGEWTPEAGPT